MGYASPPRYLAITGCGINDAKLAQRCMHFDIFPVNYTFFSASSVTPNSSPHARQAIPPRNELTKGVIKGEMHVLVASMTMKEIFHGAKSFKQAVFENVYLELDQFSLIIYNANVKQLVDMLGHEYFSYLDQKMQQQIYRNRQGSVQLHVIARASGLKADCEMQGDHRLAKNRRLCTHVSKLIKVLKEGRPILTSSKLQPRI